MHWGKKKYSAIWGTTKHWLWTHTDSWRPKTSWWSTSQTRGLSGSGDQWILSSGLCQSGSLNSPCDYFPSSRMHPWNRNTQQLTESPHWFSDLWSEGYYSGKSHMEATRTASILEKSKSEEIPHSWRHCRYSCCHQGLKGWRGGDSHPPHPHLTLLCKRHMGLGEWWWITACLSRWLQLQALCQMWFHCLTITTHPVVPQMQLLIWQMPFSLALLVGSTRSGLLAAGKAINTPSQIYLKGTSAPQPYVII